MGSDVVGRVECKVLVDINCQQCVCPLFAFYTEVSVNTIHSFFNVLKSGAELPCLFNIKSATIVVHADLQFVIHMDPDVHLRSA